MLTGWVASTARPAPTCVAVTATPSGPPRSASSTGTTEAGTEAGVPGVSAVTKLLASLISCASTPAVGPRKVSRTAPSVSVSTASAPASGGAVSSATMELAQVPGLVAVRLKIVTLLPARTRQTIERMTGTSLGSAAMRTA